MGKAVGHTKQQISVWPIFQGHKGHNMKSTFELTRVVEIVIATHTSF